MKYNLENLHYSASFSSKGAEIQSLKRKDGNSDIIWNGSEEIWKNHAPILFPFIGRCVGLFYEIEGNRYDFTRNHGFARDFEHTLKFQSKDEIVFELKSDDKFLKIFPYKFALITTYKLTEKGLCWNLKVINEDSKTFGFAIGTHTAFACNPSECVIEFEKKTSLQGIKTTAEGYVAPYENGNPVLFSYGEKEKGIVNIPSQGFGNGHLILNNNSDYVSLTNLKTHKKSIINTKGFKYIMLWQNTNGEGQFICIEPWHGIPDASDTNHKWEDKPELIYLKSGESFECNQDIWSE